VAGVSEIRPPSRAEAVARGRLRRAAEAARSLSERLADLGCTALAAEFRTAAHRLADPAFHVVIAGEFSLGKSTLANALLGAELLPTAVVPCTARVTRIAYGESSAARLADGEARPLAALRELVELAAARVRDVAGAAEWVEVLLPADLCRGELVLYDTPGLNESESPDEATARAVALADLLIYVVDLRRAGTLSERAGLDAWLEAAPGNVLVVANFANLVPEADRPPLRERVDRLAAAYAQPPLPRHAVVVDALGGLQARLADDAEGWQRSGMADLAATLLHAARQDRWTLAARARGARLRALRERFARETAPLHAEAIRAAEAIRSERERIAAGRDAALRCLEDARQRIARGFPEWADRTLAEARALLACEADPDRFDRLLPWLETRAEQWRRTTEQIVHRAASRAQAAFPLDPPLAATLPPFRLPAALATAIAAVRGTGEGASESVRAASERDAVARLRTAVHQLRSALATLTGTEAPPEPPGERGRLERTMRAAFASLRHRAEREIAALEHTVAVAAARQAAALPTEPERRHAEWDAVLAVAERLWSTLP